MKKHVDQAEESPSGGAYAFLDQQDDQDIEIKIEPIQNYLKFSNIGAVNSNDYQEAIQMDNDYFGSA